MLPDDNQTPRPARALTPRTTTLTATAQVVARSLSLALTVASTAVITRALGADGYADWATVLSLFAMLGFILDPGIAPVIVRRLAHGGTKNTPAPGSLLRARLALSLGGLLLIVTITVLLRGTDTLVLALVLGAQVIPRSVVLNVGAWMQAEHRLHVQSFIEVATTAGGLLALVVATTLRATAPVLAAVGVLTPALLLAVLMLPELRRLPSARSRSRTKERERVLSVLREAAPLAGGIVLVSLYTRLSTIFVNAGSNDVTVSWFLLAFQFIEQVIVLAGILAATLLPVLASRARNRDLASDPLVLDLLAAFGMMGAAGAAVLIATAEPLVVGIAGEEFRPAGRFLTLLAPTCVVLLLNFFVAYMLVAVGQGARYLQYNLIGLLCATAGNAAFTLTFGAAAATRVTWATELVVVALAAGHYLSASAAGRRALAEIAAVFAIVACAAELSGNGVLLPLPSAAAAAAAAAVAAAVLWKRGRLYGATARPHAPAER